MELADKIATMARRGAPLPYLRRVAYLECRGTEYIDTGLLPNGRSRVVCDFDTSSMSVYPFIYGSADAWLVNDFGCFYSREPATKGEYGNHNFEFFGIKGRQSIDHSNVITVYDEFGGVLATTTYEPVQFQCSYPLQLFTRNRGGVLAEYGTNAKIYSFKMYVNGIDLDIDLIPVLDLSGRPAMYDEVSGQFFYNQGTGEFAWGELDADSALVSTRGGVLNA